MCIIVAKNKGIEIPSRDILENCFDYNSHGAGLMYSYNNRVHVEKGFMNFIEFYDRLIELNSEIDLKETSLVMHFRISTSGTVDGGNCHPYPLTKSPSYLRALKYSTDVAMAHNGVIRNYTPGKDSILNDTQTFIKKYVYKMYKRDRNFLSLEENLIKLETMADSKLCFLDGKGNITTLGKFIEDNGVLYSNDTYKDFYFSYYNTKIPYSITKDIYGSYFDILDVEGINLDEETFNTILDNTYLPKETGFIDIDGLHYYNDGSYCVDSYGNVYEIDWKSYKFDYITELESFI